MISIKNKTLEEVILICISQDLLKKQENEEIKEKVEVFSTPDGLVISISQEASFDAGSAIFSGKNFRKYI